jgi:LPS-assembly lipoprotein
MWSSRRLFLLLALAGCGFTPAYGVKSPARALLDQVQVQAPKTRDDFDFVAALEAQMGRASAPRFDLAYTITTTQAGVGITVDGATTRYTLTGTADYTLTADGQRVTGGKVTDFTAFSATGSTVAGLTASADAHRRLMQALADQVVRRLVMELK